MTKLYIASSNKLYSLLLTFALFTPLIPLLPSSLQAQTLYRYQGFEGSGSDTWNYNASPSEYLNGNGPVVYGPQQVWGKIFAFNGVFNAYQGNNMWASSDLIQNSPHYVDLVPISLNNITNAQVSFKYITFNLGSWDEIEYSVMYDNGTNWNNYYPLAPNNQTWQTVTVNVPNGATHVRLRLRSRQVNGLVCAGYDEIQLTGTNAVNCSSLATGTVTTQICKSGPNAIPISVPYSAVGYFGAANQFVAELSDVNGNWNNPTIIGAIAQSGSNPAGTISSNIPSSLPNGNGYRIRVRATDPAFTGTDNGTNIVLTDLQFTLSPFLYPSGSNISCAGMLDGSIDLTVTQGIPPYTFQWVGPGGTIANSEDISNIGIGTYSVTVTDAAGCSKTQSITLSGPSLNLVLYESNITCHGANDGTATVTASGTHPPFTQVWSGPNGFSSTNSAIANLALGLYQVTVTDANGCSLTQSVLITEPAPLSLNLESPINSCSHHISCNGDNDGTITTTITGGTAPYSYTWTGPNNYNSALVNPYDLVAGTYIATITDLNGCTISQSITLTEPPAITGTLSATTTACGYNLTCYQGDDGQLSLNNVAGGCPPYEFAWNNEPYQQSTTFNQGVAGVNRVRIKDAVGCELLLTINLTAPTPLVINASTINPACIQFNTGAIDATPVGGCGPYAYAWTGPNGFTANTEDLQSLYGGLYSLTITDALGCTKTRDFNLVGQVPPSAAIACESDTVICNGDSALVEVNLTGTPPWSLVWSENGIPTVVTVNSSPYTIPVSPSSTTTIELLGVGNFCGEGQVCGRSTIAVKNCALEPSNPCLTNCFGSELVNTVDAGPCRTYTLRVHAQESCSPALSNMTISVPCGNFQSGSTDRGWPVIATAPNGDPNTGIMGIKVDNIQNFGNAALPDTFYVTYTLCDSGGCGLPSNRPLVGYKAGQCITYEEILPQVLPLAPEERGLSLYPNPSNGQVSVQLNTTAYGAAYIRIIDLKTVRQVYREDLGYLRGGSELKYTWGGMDQKGYKVPAGIYLLEFGIGETRRTTKVVRF